MLHPNLDLCAKDNPAAARELELLDNQVAAMPELLAELQRGLNIVQDRPQYTQENRVTQLIKDVRTTIEKYGLLK